MKLQKLSKTHGAGFAALLVAMTMLGGGGLMAEDATSTPAVTQTKTDATTAPVTPANLSTPTREVVKMAMSGVSEDVLKAYVYHSPSEFNLTADSIIHLKAVGVSSDVLAAMLNRDTMLRDQTALNARGAAQPPMVQPGATQTTPTYPSATTETTTPPPDYGNTPYPPTTYYDYPDYAGVYPYPYYYPYGYYGGWYFTVGRGWLWYPHGHFGGRGFVGAPFGGGFRGGIRSFSGGHGGAGHGGGGHGGGGHR